MLHRRTWFLAVTLALVVAAGAHVRPQSAPPAILLIVNQNAANPYGAFLKEILSAEGVKSFAVADLSSVTPGDLAAAPLVVLAETALTGPQATMIGNYIAAGGRLVAMRPDPQLMPALGLTPLGTSTSEGYLGINSEAPSMDGFTTATLPFHGLAQHVSAAPGSTALATLYADSTTATPFPAIVKSGSTVTWTYDLARTVVYTRQGNPANASDRDGQPPYRTTDIFYNAVDLDKVAIPHADVQMRMFARVISDLLSDVTPMPRLWYFPGANRTLMVLTADSHANPQSYFDEEIASIEARGGRASIYVYNGGPSLAAVEAWRASGHEVGMHPAGYQNGWSLDTALQANQDFFTNSGFGAPSQTIRNHQVEWQGWVEAAKVAAAHGVGMDTSYYTWGPAVTYSDGHQAHGYINGSGLPLHFIDQAGAIVPVYQQVTSLIDEALVIGELSEHLTPAQAILVSRQLIDASQAGDYAAITTQFHVDYFGYGEVQPWAEGTMDYARSLGIPMWPAERWLSFTQARAATTMTGLLWSPSSRQLSFALDVPSSADAQSLAFPAAYGGFGLRQVTIDGVPAGRSQRVITGRLTVLFGVAPGLHNVVAYYDTTIPPAERPPVAAADAASVIEGQTVTIPVLSNDSDPDGDLLSVVSTSPNGGAAIAINPDQTISYAPYPGTCGIDTFTYTISDGQGGIATADVSVSVTCVTGQITQTTEADFAACAVPVGTIVTHAGNGEIRLAGLQGDDYSQPILDPAKWVAGTWSGGAYSPTITAGVLSLSNASGVFVRSAASLPVTTLEGSVRFTGLPWEHVGWGSLNFDPAYALFSTYNSSANLFARTLNVGNEQRTDLGAIPPGFHTYRIERQSDTATTDLVSYYIDGTLRAQHLVATLPPMYVYQSNNGGSGNALEVGQLWVYPNYVGAGTFQSCTLDIGNTLSSWTTASWSAVSPIGTSLQFRTRSSIDAASWSTWSTAMTTSGQPISSPPGRYLQYLLELSTANPGQSPIVDSVTVRYADASGADRPPIAVHDSASTVQGVPITVSVLDNDIDMDGDPMAILSATPGTQGIATVNSTQTVTYTPNVGSCGTDEFAYTINDGRGETASATVTVMIRCLSGQASQGSITELGNGTGVGTIVTRVGDGEVRLAGTQDDEFSGAALDPAKWVAGTWVGGGYAPVLTAGALSIADPNGAYVRSSVDMPVTSLEGTIRFTNGPWQHVGWGNLDFAYGYLLFSTFNTSTNLFARSYTPTGEMQTDLGPIPVGFHLYRIDRQTSSPTTDLVSYYIDGVLRAQHTVPTLSTTMHVYQSNSGGGTQTLDIDRLWVYPAYVSTGTFQSATLDAGNLSAIWTAAAWNAAVPAGTTLQVRTRTSTDATHWTSWSLPLTASGQTITSPPGRFIQYLLELATSDAVQSPVVDSVTMQFAGTTSATQETYPQLGNGDGLGTIVTRIGDGEVRLAGTQGDEFSGAALDPARWVAGTWAGGAYAPVLTDGALLIADPDGAYVRSSVSMPVTSLEATVRFTNGAWQHVGWGNLDFAYGYLLFSTYNTSTNLFARSYSPTGEMQTDLGPIPVGFHQYRIDRQTSSPTTDLVSYYIDGVLRAQHTVPTLSTTMHVYQSNNNGGTLDIDRLWVYPAYVSAGTFESASLDAGSLTATWTTAAWNAVVPAGTTLQVRTRTSTDATHWTSWSLPLTASGQPITSPPGRFLQYLLELATGDFAQSPVVDSVTMQAIIQ